ncbi:MAG TPA: adventurous gliding motility protein GltC [Anaeromyxobacteraceae bacterium]|nr:adventurous gliding motility protein GltC [Anaeromyxobacteraceae bacterium]
MIAGDTMVKRLASVLALALAALVYAAPAAAQLGIDLTPDEKAREPAKRKPGETAAPPAPTAAPQAQPSPVTMPELDLGARKGEGGRRVAEANKVFATGDYETAALAYDAVLRDAALAEAHDEARYQLAKSLFKLGLYHSSLAKLDEILSKGPQGSKYFYNALEWLFQVGQKVNESVIVAQVARYAGATFPPGSTDRMSYLLSRYSYERGQALDELGRGPEARKAYEDARRLASQVHAEAGQAQAPREGEEDLYARAQFIEGLVDYSEGSSQAAVDAFKEVVRLTNPRRARAADPRVREMAFLELARIHYEHKQNRYAIFYYDRMPRGGDSWLEGLWEASYAHYRIGDYEKALGNLLTLQSPYFKDEWFPESWILKAIIYYENCRYPEARAILDEFRGAFQGVYEEIDRLTAQKTSPANFYDLFQDAQKGSGQGAHPSMRRIFKVALGDRNVKRLNDSILEVEAEMDQGLPQRREAFRGSALAKDLRERLASEKRRMLDEAGARARAKLEYERDALKELLQEALRIKIEVARKEREALETSLTHGGPVDVIRDYRYSVAVSDEHVYWPYDGEFWRDELGTYTYTLTKGCRDTGAR